jgi:RNA polymerase sigma-70 factor (ECF subfamily)
MNSTPTAGSVFRPTRWSQVHRAQGRDEESRKALAELCEAYWMPVYHVLRRRGRSDDNAREMTQAFFAHVLEGGRLAGADPSRGRFRSYLIGALRHFESDLREREGRLKRGGAVVTEPFDSDQVAGAMGEPWDDAVFDREWAAAVVARALAALGEDYAASDRAALFERLRPAIDGGELGSQAYLAAELGLTEGALKVAIHRLRRRFREAVLAEIAQTLPDGGDVEGELRYLVEVLGHNRARGC